LILAFIVLNLKSLVLALKANSLALKVKSSLTSLSITKQTKMTVLAHTILHVKQFTDHIKQDK